MSDRRMPKEPELADFFAELARTGVAPDTTIADRRTAQYTRQQRLDAADCAITAEDRRNIIRDTLRPTEALSTVRQWSGAVCNPQSGAPAPTAFLVLIGDAGRGKTVACAWAAANYQTARFISGPELTQLRIRSRYDARAAEQLLQIQAAGLVILDDLCRDNHPPREEADALFGLVHGRQRAGYHTLVTTNHDMGLLRERLGQYVADRLEHTGLHVQLKGPNLRRTG